MANRSFTLGLQTAIQPRTLNPAIVPYSSIDDRIVIDFGSQYIKAGYSGEMIPRMIAKHEITSVLVTL